ncbi:MAG TPA: hypothetical protein VLC91_14395 [Spongiibacteraceae bacterium]|nr:hypothetical protein [Spongiibacteraceae bacterium]
MAITVGSAAQKSPQTPTQSAKPRPQGGKEGKDAASKPDLAPALKQAAQFAANPALNTAAKVATQAVGAFLNTKA